MWNRVYGWLWRSCRRLSVFFLEMSARLWAILEWIHCGNRDRQKQIAEKRPATKPWLFAWPQGGVPQNTHRDRIRQLLCDNAACKVCERTTQEAVQLVYSKGAGSHDPASLKLPLSPVSCTERPVLPGAFFERGHDSLPQTVSAPAPVSALEHHLAPVRRAASNKSLHFPSLPTGKQEKTICVAKRAAHGWKERSSWAVDHNGQREEDTFSLSSATYSTSFTTWTESSSGLSEDAATCRHLKDFRSSSCPMTALRQQKGYGGPSQVDNEAFVKACHHKRVNVTTTVLTVQRDVVSRTKVRSALLPAGPSRTQMTDFTPPKLPFVEDAVTASLESHLVVKRVHHLLGLPLALLRSLRTFMSPAPYSASQRHWRKVGVVTRPQVLFFVAEDARKKLELHLKKMVQLKRWQLPWRVQEALRHMKPPSQPREEKSPSAFQKQRPRVTGLVESTRKMQKTIAKLPSSAHVLDSKTTSGSQAKLQVHFMKKSLEMRLDIFPAVVGHSQKMTKTRARKRPLPSLIPFGQSCPQLRNRLCLSLRGKADSVEMSTKCKYLHFLWGLPTLYMQSLAKISPSTPTLPTTLSRVHGFVEFGHAELPFIALSAWKDLGSHVLRKRLQHQWGLPGLVQQSLKRFLMPASISTHVACVSRARLEVKIFTGVSQLLFTSLQMKQQLETHVRSKIVERRWGLPRRVLESLQVFMPVSPPLIKRLREGEKTFWLPLMKEKVVKRAPSTVTSSSSKKSAGSSEKPCPERSWGCKRQALQRHVAKKALEIRLGVASSVVQQSQKTACQAGKCVLSKAAIPPWSKPREPRSQELLFVNEAVLAYIQLNIIHKNLTCKWGLPTVYNKSLAQLFQDSGSPARTAFLSVRSAVFSFTGREILFIGQRTQEVLEWHVKRKTLQHIWGLPGLMQRSLRYFLPAVPRIRWKAGHREVAVFQTELSFLSKATKQGLEKNVQKRVLHQRWLLPRRVLESLKLLYPTYGFGSMTSPEPWKVGAVRKEQAPKRATRGTEAPHQTQLLPTLQAEGQQVTLQLHLAKKCLEVHFETLPSVVRVSWRCTFLLLKRPLPKTILPGKKPLLSRRSLLPFAGQEQMHRIDVAVRRNQLACLWELGMRYVEALGGMMSGPPSHSPRQRWAAIDFMDVQMPLPPGIDREALELHVKRKRIQHKWGFPVLIHRSLMGLIHGPPSLTSSIKTNICVHVLVPDLLFLPRNICNHLEFHLQKMKLHRLWGLPRRVLESLRLLHPEFKAGTPRQKPSGFPFEPGVGRFSGKAGRETLTVSPVKRRMVAAIPHILQGVPMRGSKNLEKIQLHLAKKWVEMQLEAFPSVAVRSRRCTVLKSRQPLPRLVLCGCKPLQLRKCFLPFVPKEQMGRMEVSMHLCYLSSLWGMGMRYVEASQAMIPPKPFSQPLRCRRAVLSLSQVQAQFVQGQNQNMLELHVRKKRLQHEWGFPLLIQRSLRAFMQVFPLGPGFRKTTVPIQVLQQELSFLRQGTCSHLEHHLQRLKLQRQWGLPKRIVESLRLLFSETEHPPHEWKATLSERSFSGAPSHGTRPQALPVGAINTEQDRKKGPRMLAAAPQQTQLRLILRAKAVEKLQLHLSKKSLEVHLELFPAVLRISGRRASLSQSQPLPRPIHPDLRSLKPRSCSFSLGREEMNRIELALQRSHFASLWGLGTRYVEAVAGMVPKLSCPLVRLHEAAFAFSEVETLFFRQRVRETLELHIRRKRIQHEWGSPVLVQRSLRGFIQETPTLSGLSKSVTDICVLHQELLFFPWDVCSHLEHHLQRRMLQRKWGLPGRVLESLRLFLPSASLGRALLPQGDKKVAQAESSTGKAQTADMRQVKTSNIAPEKAHALQYHLTRKRFQICLEVHPGLLSQSRAGQSGKELKYLPRLIHKGQKQPRCRAFFLLFLLPGTVDILEMNVKLKYLTFLWGLPNKCLEPLSIVDHARCSPVRTSQVGFRFQKLQTPFLRKEARETLEYHIQKKRFHHFWGFPSAIQHSLRAFTPPASTDARPPHRIGQKIRIQVEHLPFVSEFVQKNLENNLKKMIIHGHWGLPKKMHRFLHSLIPNPPEKSVDGGVTFPYGPDMKDYIVRLPQATCVDAPFKGVSSGASMTFSPIVELFNISKINILETHLRKKSLEIKFQLMARHKIFIGSIKQILLPKLPLHFSMVKPRRAFLLFVEEEPLVKIQLNVSHKYLTYLWGLPSLHTESLHKLSGKVPECLPRKVATVRSTLKVPMLGREATGEAMHHGRLTETSVVSGGAHCRSPKLGPPFLTDEALDLLESHIKNKKIQHTWGLPATIQKSLRKFAPFLSEPQRSSVQLGIAATHSQGGREVRVAAQRLLFFDPAIMEHLEEHMRSQIAGHRWHLPRRIQESLKKFLPPESLFQVEGSKDQAQILPGTCDQIPQAATEPAQRKASGLPRNKFHQVKRAAPFLTNEAFSLLEFHTRQKRIQHEWGLPSTVQKSLRAFVLLPPKPPPRSTKAGAAAFVTSETVAGREKGRSVNVQVPRSAVHVTIPSQELPFLSADTINCLEVHMRSRATKHKWRLPKLMQDLLRALVPLQLEPPEKQKGNLYPGKRMVACLPGVTAFLPPAREPMFLPREIQNLLEFHIQHKKVQRAWGLPSTVLKSLSVFAQFPLEAEKHTPATEEATVADKLPRARGGVQVTTTQSLLFLTSDTKEHLESHVRSITTEHRWGLPKRVQESLKRFLPAVSPSGETRPQTQPPLPHDSKSLQDSFIQPQFETESSVQKFQDQREAPEEFTEKQEPTATSVTSARARFMDCAEEPPSLTVAVRRVLELHIQHKKIQHEWGLPALVQKSLQAFAPVPREPQGSLQSAQGVNVAAGRPKNHLLAGMRVGAKKRWVEEEVNAAAQKLHFLNPNTKEHLEAHVGTLTVEHRWHLLGLTQKSARSFVPAAYPSQTGGIQDQGLLSTCYHDKTCKGTGTEFQTETKKEATSSSKESHRYRSELFYKMGQDGGSVLWQTAEDGPLHPVAEPQHFTGTCGSWKAGRATPRTGLLQKKSLQRSSLHVRSKKATSGQCSRISVKVQGPGMSPASLFGPLPSKYVGKTSCWSEKLPSSKRATSPSGRVPSTVRGRDPAPRPSKGISWQPECGIQRMAGSSHRPPGKQPRSPEASPAGWELGGPPKKFRYPCKCHLATSRKDSTSSLHSDAEQRWWRQEEEGQGKAAKTDESQSVSSLLSGESMKNNAPLPEQEASAKPLGVAQQHNAPISWPATGSSTELSHVVESHSACEDMAARHDRQQAGGGRQGKGSRDLRRRGSTLGWSSTESSQVPGDANINAEQNPQGAPAHGLQPQTGTEGGGGAQRPLSVGGASQFSTESEREKVGDWASEEEEEEEEAVGESKWPREEEGGSAKAAEEAVGPRRAESPAAKQPQAPAETSLVREARAILRDMRLRITAGQAAPEPLGHHIAPQSATDEMGRDTEAQLLPEPQSGALQCGVFGEEMHASVEVKRAEILLQCEGGERTAVGEASVVTTRGKGQPVEQGQETPFIGGVCTSEKCSILGRILEKKLYLRHGLDVWMRSSERLRVSREEEGTERGTSAGHTKREMESSLGKPPEASHRGRQTNWPRVELGTGAEGRRPDVHCLRAERGGPLVADGFLPKEKGDQSGEK